MRETMTTSYDVLTLDRGESRTIELTDDEELTDTLIDCSAANASIQIRAIGSNWLIENVGIKGENNVYGPTITAAEIDPRKSVIRNVYLGDGVEHDHLSNGTAIYVPKQNSGAILIDGVNCEGWLDHAIHASDYGPTRYIQNGRVDVEHSFCANNYSAHYRIARGRIDDSVAVNTSTGPNGRAVWAWRPGEVGVGDCIFEMNGRHYSFCAGSSGGTSTIRVMDTAYDDSREDGYKEYDGEVIFEEGNSTDPERVIPDGCPATAEDAAAGDSNGEDPWYDPNDWGEYADWYVSETRDPEHADEPAPDAARLSVLPPRGVDEHDRLVTVRSLGDEPVAVYIWFETSQLENVDRADAYGASSVALDIHETGIDGELVRADMLLRGRDTENEDVPGRFSRVTLASSVPIHDIHMAEPEAAGGVQIEMSEDGRSWIRDARPPELAATGVYETDSDEDRHQPSSYADPPPEERRSGSVWINRDLRS